MRRWLLALLLVPVLALPSLPPVFRAQAQSGLDYDLPVAGGAHFFSQADGAGGATGTGYAVSNADGIPFWDFFRAAGGVQAVGYPVSHRFVWNGFTVQAFQKVIFQWRPEVNTVYYVNVLDEINARGLDGYLQSARQVPPPADWSGDTGLPFAQVVSRHLELLSANPAIAAAYNAEPDPINRNGLPMAPIQNMGNVQVLRAQRKVYQQWLIDVPWARAGQVVIANGGDLGKEVGLYPTAAITPQPAASVPLTPVSITVSQITTATPTATTTPAGSPTPSATPTLTITPTATPVPPGICNGDEQIAFNPPTPVTGQLVTIQVTSARPLTNVALTGPLSPVFTGVQSTNLLTTWTWTVTPTQPGRYDYNFTVNGAVCKSNFMLVGGGATATPTFTPTPVSGLCNGDETMFFNPPSPGVGQQVYIGVTSSRPSANVGLSGPVVTSFVAVQPGGRGTVWWWTVTPSWPGRYDFNFTVNGVTCTSNFMVVGATATPTATDTQNSTRR